MAEAKLNFDESQLDKSSGIYDLYSRLYEGMRVANTVDAPISPENPPLDSEGQIDVGAINTKLSEYSEILMKNSAYLFANSIMSVIGLSTGGGDAGVGFLSRNGDTMMGSLGALYGLQAGYGGNLIFETTVDSDDKAWANITGNLSVSDNVVVQGALQLSEHGIEWGENKVIYHDGTALHIDSQDVAIKAKVSVDGSIVVGNVVIDENGIKWGEHEFYHSGNSNKKDVDWTMKNAYVHGTLYAYGDAEITKRFITKGALEFSYGEQKLLFTETDETTQNTRLLFYTDLALINGKGIKFGDKYIVKVRNDDKQVVSFSAPGMIMNLGDSDGETATDHIALQSEIWNYNSAYRIISQYGDGNFPNSFSAGCANAGPTVIRTYYVGSEDCGVVLLRNMRLGDVSGPILAGSGNNVLLSMPYLHIVSDLQQTDFIPINIGIQETTSLFKDQTKQWSSTIHFNTEAEFFAFDKPIESTSFSIKSEQYKTRLIENTLFFDDGKFLEGVTDGIRWSGNAYFDGNLSSPRFASGFAGYGWAVMEDEMVGGISATFDSLTVRKKMRVYELEVQKISVTNGSLWVSDSCSGDEVVELI